MFKGAKKDDLRLIATEINIPINDKMTIADLKSSIENSDLYKNELDFVVEIANTIIEDRKNEEQMQIDIEKMKFERSKNELEIAKIRSETKSNFSENEIKCESLDQLIKSVRTLTVKVPIRPEGWGFFFSSLERAFKTKNILEQFKAEILLNLLGDKASNIITYLHDKDIDNYEKIKQLVLKQYQPTPYSCLEQFRKANKQPNETHVQFASRLVTNWEYYLNLRKVSDYESLKQLIVSDKLYQTLDRETASHISVRQGDKWFGPEELGKDIDLYFTSRGKSLTENFSVNRKNINSKSVSKVFLSDSKTLSCVLCHENHSVANCPHYLKLSVYERVNVVKNNKLCFNCLNLHSVANCPSKYTCFCKKLHHKTIHFPKVNKNTYVKESPLSEPHKQGNNYVSDSSDSRPTNYGTSNLNANAEEFIHKTFISNYSNIKSKVLLSTVKCYLIDESGYKYRVKCLLDVGSESNFLSRHLIELMKIKKEKTNILVSGLNDATLIINHKVNASICNKEESFVKNLDFLVVPKITADLTPCKPIDISIQDFPNVKLADDKFNIPEHVDMLLGAGIFYELLKPGQIHVNNSDLILQDTVFGFVVSGSFPIQSENKVHCGFMAKETNLDKTLKRFWEIENIEVEKPKSKENLICEKHFIENYTRDKTGRYTVKMPLREDPATLGNSKQIAIRKLNSLWNRLTKDPEYLILYSNFLKEYEKLGHMVEVSEIEEEKGSYYIPHLGVYRGVERSTSTPLRVVFNASSLTTKSNSLNSIQYNGGVIQEDLFSIMLKFRKYIFAFTADIQKMYRAISIHPDQRKLQKILWKEGLNKPIKIFELTTVTYGTVSAPFLAMRTLLQLSRDEGSKFPLAATVLKEDMYMDDILSGANSLSSALELQNQLIDILKSGGMLLHKWCSNAPELCQTNDKTYPFGGSEESKALGVLWKSRKDCLSFNVKIPNEVDVTKRQVLSIISSLFDPLGLVAPVIIKAKIFIQKLWLLKLNWDDFLPEKEAKEWRDFSATLQSINNIEISRCILQNDAVGLELHGFSDASESAYGAAIYCKSVKKCGQVSVKLVTSKSRVSPLKQLTVPKLELCAAVLLSKLVQRVITALKVTVQKTILWSDSMIVLSWIKKEPFQLKTFVANRISIVQELTEGMQWRHVPSEHNPADLLTRGVDSDKLISNELWWTGPVFLKEKDYPNRDIYIVNCDDFHYELKDSNDSISVFTVSINSFVHNIISLSNNYSKIIRIVAFIFRFITNCKGERTKGPLDTKEFNRAEFFLLKRVQFEEFNEDIKTLQKSGNVNINSRIKSLHPFLDEKGLLRVGGRLVNSNLNVNQKFPILLHSKSKLTQLIVEYYHKRYLHLGPQALLFQLRQKFWPLNGRTICRKIVHSCITCFKVKPVSYQQLLGNLPKERVSESYPFNCSGVDLTGPFLIKYKYQRKGIYHKVYVAIFICLATRAVHLEIVTDLTSQAFIETLKRFFARRGKVACIFSDNAQNFIGCNNELKRLHNLVKDPDNNLSGYLSSEGVNWKFIPPRAPNFGGLWEAGVKSFKYHLKRGIGKAKLTYEGFLTVIIQIEGILNSRPLVPLSSDPDDLNALTPGHFLIGRPINSIVEPEITHIHDSKLKLWQRTTKLIHLFWKKWSKDYLSSLQQRAKWYFEKDNVKVNDLVIIKEDNVAICNWPLGRIVELFPGNDGIIRVLSVKTQRGVFKRPITKICLLPMEK